MVDLLGQGGIQVNGRRVRSAHLEEGDRVEFAGLEIFVSYKPPGEAPLLIVDHRPKSDAPTGIFDPRSLILGSGKEMVPVLPVTGLGLTSESGSMLTPFLEQFSRMQQQMFDQFHQSMLLMVQMFGDLHRDQMAMIREELDRVYKITQELNSLQAELSKGRPAGKGLPGPGSLPPVPRPLPLLPPLNPGTSAGGTPSAAGTDGASATSQPQEPPSSVTAGQSSEDPHDWLNRRIAEIQQERQSRWQKILGFLRGKGPEQAGP
jgi:hypothetical protein